MAVYIYIYIYYFTALHIVWILLNSKPCLINLTFVVQSIAIQSRVSEIFGMDIHPACTIGSSIMMDHATGVVIGETARVGDGCTLLHGVTLGGTGKVSV